MKWFGIAYQADIFEEDLDFGGAGFQCDVGKEL